MERLTLPSGFGRKAHWMNSRALKPEATNQVRRHGFGMRNVALIIALPLAA